MDFNLFYSYWLMIKNSTWSSSMLLLLPDYLPSCDILQHVTQCEEDPPDSFELARRFRHRVLVQDLLLQTQTHTHPWKLYMQRKESSLVSLSTEKCHIKMWNICCWMLQSHLNYGQQRRMNRWTTGCLFCHLNNVSLVSVLQSNPLSLWNKQRNVTLKMSVTEIFYMFDFLE